MVVVVDQKLRCYGVDPTLLGGLDSCSEVDSLIDVGELLQEFFSPF